MEVTKVIIFLWLLVCAWHDLRKREVPDRLTMPAVVLTLGYRLLTPEDWLPWALAGLTVLLTLAGVLHGGDMKGLVALSLFDPRWYLAAWLGTGLAYLFWRGVRRERRMPGYIGFLVGVVGLWLVASGVNRG